MNSSVLVETRVANQGLMISNHHSKLARLNPRNHLLSKTIFEATALKGRNHILFAGDLVEFPMCSGVDNHWLNPPEFNAHGSNK